MTQRIQAKLAVAGVPTRNGNIFSLTTLNSICHQLRKQINDRTSIVTFEDVLPLKKTVDANYVCGRVREAWVNKEDEFNVVVELDDMYALGFPMMAVNSCCPEEMKFTFVWDNGVKTQHPQVISETVDFYRVAVHF